MAGDKGSGAGPTRRTVLSGAGAAVAGGVLATTVSTAGAAGREGVATAPPAVNAVEFRGRIRQTGSNGQNFEGWGFLTRVVGLADADLFAGGGGVGAALLTLHAAGNLVNRQLDQAVHALDIVGQLDIYERSAPGADFAEPDSFTAGRRVAGYDMTLQDVLAVFAPAQGLPTLNGDMRQTFADRLASGALFGSNNLRSRLLATGLGTLVDPVTLNAELEMAGNWSLD